MTDLEHLAAFFAFTHKQHSFDGVSHMIDDILTVRSGTITYELFEKIIEELRGTGLLRAAEDLDKITLDKLPHVWELPCPEPPPHDKAWYTRMKAKQEAWEARETRCRAILEPPGSH